MEFHAGAFFICAHRVSGVGTYFGFGVPLNAPHDVPSIDAAPPPAAVFQHRKQSHAALGHSPASCHYTPPSSIIPKAHLQTTISWYTKNVGAIV